MHRAVCSQIHPQGAQQSSLVTPPPLTLSFNIQWSEKKTLGLLMTWYFLKAYLFFFAYYGKTSSFTDMKWFATITRKSGPPYKMSLVNSIQSCQSIMTVFQIWCWDRYIADPGSGFKDILYPEKWEDFPSSFFQSSLTPRSSSYLVHFSFGSDYPK